MTPSETLYRIRPLVWEDEPDGAVTHTILGAMTVRYRKLTETWEWDFYSNLKGGCKSGQCENMESGKTAAEAYYRSRIAEGLEVPT